MSNKNPWNKNPQVKSRKSSDSVLRNAPTRSELKFKEAHGKLQAAVKKHVKDYESSSEEEDLESENILDGVLKTYTQTGGQDEYLGRTKTFLQDALLSGTATCLICISRVKRESSIWSCSECYCVFHLTCIQRWSKDSIFQQKQILENPIQVRQITLTWGCPKCRHDYKLEDVPDKYYCFCKKTVEPKFQPFLVPHSCGEICRKDLKPLCGHKCLLLCHPGPCPPCPVTIGVSCYCGSQPPKTQRCSNKEWSCGNRCGKLLACQKHTCSDPCHAGDCRPCSKKSLQKCLCKSSQKLRDCATPTWQCDKVCNKPLECGNHNCSVLCHEGDCDSCPLTQLRTCPCGKSKYQLPCTEETPTCLDTCDKLLKCGLHRCNQRCHKDDCGVCLETVEKLCKCGLHSKEVHCYKPYFCETKCKRMKDCNKHPCNKKCCDGNCPPCDKPCGRTLNCSNHKCSSVCHRGLCYPCNQTETVTCRCGATKLEVPCGRKHKTRPPKCNKLCLIPPDCHHERREHHRCHFGDCPPCKQICNKGRLNCTHLCKATCHSAVIVKIEGQKPSMPWEQTKPQLERKNLPCPECEVPVPVTCLGEHETCDWPCYKAKPSSCHRPCGRLLHCGNHTCTLTCHLVELAQDKIQFWDWFIRLSDIRMHWKNQPTYVISQFAFIFGAVATLIHAITRKGRLPYLWLGIIIHGIVIECLSYILPDVDNFWHSQTPIIFLGRRLPLHIIFLYACFIYNSSIAVAKMRLPRWAEPFAVGLGSVLIDIPYDLVSVNFLHWTWHDTDPNIADRHYWVPWNSYYFHATFAASFTFWFHLTRKYICKSEGKWISDKSIFKEILCSVIAGILGTPGGILLFLPIYHPLHDIYKLHSEVTFFIIFAMFLLIIWSADRVPKTDDYNKTAQHKTHWTTWLLIGHLLIHYTSFLVMPILFNPEDEVSMGVRERIGPCNEYVPVQTAFGMTLQKRKFLCASDYDEKYFDWHCLSGKPPSNGSYWYTTCGVPFPNRVEIITIAALIWAVGAAVFYNLHFRSSGDDVFDRKDIIQKDKSMYKKMKKH